MLPVTRLAPTVTWTAAKTSVRSVNTLINNARKDEADVMPFESIPSVPKQSWPLIGQLPSLIYPYGIERAWKRLLELKHLYVPDDVNMLRLHLPPVNKKGNGRVVYLFDPEDVKAVHINEGACPSRGDHLSIFGFLRKRRQDLFGQKTGLLTEEGEAWRDIRKSVQQDFLRPKAALYYLNDIQEGFHCASGQFAFEAISVIAIDTKMGTLRPNPNLDVLAKLNVGQKLMLPMTKLAFKNPSWQYLPEIFSPTLKKAERYFDEYSEYVHERVQEASARIREKNKDIKNLTDDSFHDRSVLEKLIIRNGPDSPIPFVMAMDMLFAGIDTTGNTAGFLLYHLARNQGVQEKLRQEIQNLRGPVTESDIGRMKYFKACLQENFRLTPTANAMARFLSNDAVIRNYCIPKGTTVIWNFVIFGRDERLFSNPEKFQPERWITNEPRGPKSVPMFAVRPFGYGPRMCIGKRFAELELQLLICELLRNFKIEWAGTSKEIDPVYSLVNCPNFDLKFKFTDIN